MDPHVEGRVRYAEVTFFEPDDARARVEEARGLVEAAVELLQRDHGLTSL